MKLAVVIVGIDGWEQYTKLLIEEIKSVEPAVLIYCVDAGSKAPYPPVDRVWMDHQRTKSYAEAINLAADRAFASGADWVLSMNNDVSCMGKFAHCIEPLQMNAIYARQIIEEKDLVWFGNWIVAIPFQVWSAVGAFDPDYLVCGFEDADYSQRAIQKGFRTLPIELPFHHHWGTTRWGVPNYPAIRLDNIRRFASKHGWTPGNNMEVTHD